MQIQTRHRPTFAVVRVTLAAGEAVQVVADAMFASSFGVTETKQSRSATARSVFTAPAEGGWLDLAPPGANDVCPVEFDGEVGWNIARGGLLARPATINADESWPALRTLFGADNGFLEHYSGRGSLIVSSPGPVDTYSLEAGEVITVLARFVLGYPDTVQCRVRALDPAAPQSIRSGAGLVMDFAGPGNVLVQARPRPD